MPINILTLNVLRMVLYTLLVKSTLLGNQVCRLLRTVQKGWIALITTGEQMGVEYGSQLYKSLLAALPNQVARQPCMLN